MISKQLYQDEMGVFSRSRLFCYCMPANCTDGSVSPGVCAVAGPYLTTLPETRGRHWTHVSAVITLCKRTTIHALQPLLVAIPGAVARVCWGIAMACCLVTHCHTSSSPPSFSWGVALLPEGKSWGLHSVQLYAKHRQGKLHRVLTVSVER